MAGNQTIKYRRKREGVTDYRQRLKLLQGRKLRLVIRKSSRYIVAQLVDYAPKGDLVIVGANSLELKKYGWVFGMKNIPSAYLTGYLLAHKAKSKKIKDAVLDIGLQVSVNGSRLYAVVQGMIDGGIKELHCPQEALPSKERVIGNHIVNYAQKAEGNQFSSYKKSGLPVQDIQKILDKVKEAIQKSK